MLKRCSQTNTVVTTTTYRNKNKQSLKSKFEQCLSDMFAVLSVK